MTSGFQMGIGEASSGSQLPLAVFLEPGKPLPLGSSLFIQNVRKDGLLNPGDTVCLSWRSTF